MKVQKENVDINKIAVGDEITTETIIPLMPVLWPEKAAEALLKIVYLDKNITFVVNRLDSKQQIPWFYVQVLSSHSDSFGELGWINGLALLRKDDEKNKENKENEKAEKNNKEGKTKSLQQLLETIGLNPVGEDNKALGS